MENFKQENINGLTADEVFGSFDTNKKGRVLDNEQLLEEMNLPDFYKCPYCKSIRINHKGNQYYKRYKTPKKRYKCLDCKKVFVFFPLPTIYNKKKINLGLQKYIKFMRRNFDLSLRKISDNIKQTYGISITYQNVGYYLNKN